MVIYSLFGIFVAGFTRAAIANVIQVPSAHSTIQAGINAAASGDTVLVAPGTYTGPSNRNLDFGGRNIVLRSSAGSATTIIDCQNLARGIRFHTAETAAAIVQGFTIRNGLASGTFGGGILVESGARPSIRACRFQSNHANSGGGVFISSAATLTDCDFEENSADNFGGGAYGETADLQATRCSFAHNTAGFGAGIYAQFGTTLMLSDCSFTDNAPANLGGGVYTSGSTVTILRCTFNGNTGRQGAGAYLLDGTASVDSCTFTANIADYGGGGMYAKEIEPLAVSGCTFQDNVALAETILSFDKGGGGLKLASSPTAHITDCVFTGNQAFGEVSGDGGGMAGKAFLERCVFIDNHADSGGGGALCSGTVHQCVFEGNTSLFAGGLDGGYEIIDCRFTDNHSLNNGGGCWPSGGTSGCTIIDCEFSGNSTGNQGGALVWLTFRPLTIEDCQFSDNYATQGGAIFAYLHDPSSITGCTFVGNSAAAGGALNLTGPTPTPAITVSNCTMVANDAQVGGGLHLTIPVEVSNTIIGFGAQGEAIACSGAGIGVMSCTDIFGNAGGNWTACISDQLGINGNFSLDPRFCNRGGRNFTLAQSSPCTATNAPAGCGLIGAYPVGCATPIGIADAGAPSVTPILRVSPNPIRGTGTIEWSRVGGGNTMLRLYDVAGRLVARRMEMGSGGSLAWSTLVGASDVPSGVYLLEVGDDHAVRTHVRLVVLR